MRLLRSIFDLAFQRRGDPTTDLTTVSRDRAANEIEHGRYLATSGAESVWGWETPAGRLRAKRRADLIARGAGLRRGMDVLEVGCGTGLFTELLAPTGANLLAVDISPDLLDIARRRGLDPAQVRFLAGRFEAIDLPGPFDAVLGSSVLHHLDVPTSIAKIRSLLKPGGTICFAEPNMANPQIFIQKNVPWIKRRLGDSPDETAFWRWKIERQLKDAGFINVVATPFDWLHPATPAPLIPLVRAFGMVMEQLPAVREFAGSLVFHATAP